MEYPTPLNTTALHIRESDTRKRRYKRRIRYMQHDQETTEGCQGNSIHSTLKPVDDKRRSNIVEKETVTLEVKDRMGNPSNFRQLSLLERLRKL